MREGNVQERYDILVEVHMYVCTLAIANRGLWGECYTTKLKHSGY